MSIQQPTQIARQPKTLLKHPGGRPTKYKKRYIAEVDEYIAKAVNSRTILPKVEDLAPLFKVNIDTLYEWSKVYPEFSDALSRVKNAQLSKLIDDGIYKRTNSPIVKLALMNNHGYKERSDQTSNDKVLPTPLLFNLIKEEGVIVADNPAELQSTNEVIEDTKNTEEVGT